MSFNESEFINLYLLMPHSHTHTLTYSLFTALQYNNNNNDNNFSLYNRTHINDIHARKMFLQRIINVFRESRNE